MNKKRKLNLSLNTNRMANKGDWLSNLVLITMFVVLVALSLYNLTKVGWGLLTSLKSTEEFIDGNIVGLPEGNIWEWKWENISYILSNFYTVVTNSSGQHKVWIEEMLLNTLLFAGGGAVISITVCSWMSYLIQRYPYKFSSVLYYFVLFIMFIPLVGTNAGMLKVLRTIGLYDTMFGWYLIKFNFSGTNLLLFYAFLSTIPKDYDEAAYIDGANQFQVFAKVILPMMSPMILTLMLQSFIGFWDDYMTPLIFLPSYPTLSLGVYSIVTSTLTGLSRTPFKLMAAFIVSIPAVILFLLSKSKMLEHMNMGGIKG